MPRPARGYWIEPAPTSGIYRLCWTEDRRKRTRSLATRDHEAALHELERLKAQAREAEHPFSPTVAGVLDAWWLHKGSPKILKPTLDHLRRHLGWITIDDLRPSHTSRYAIERTAAPGTIRLELQKLSAALNWALGERLIPVKPAVRYPPAPPPKERWLTREEAARLLEACAAFHVRLFCQIALRTAARKQAILDLLWTQVDLDARRIHFRRPGELQTSKRRPAVPINATLMADLLVAKAAAQSPHVIEYGGGRVVTVHRGFANACARAGFGDVTPHTLRHTAAAWMAMEGVPMRKIALYLGHTSERITESVYAHFSPDYLSDAGETLD